VLYDKSQFDEFVVLRDSVIIIFHLFLKGKGKKVKADITLHGNPISELRDVTCHVGSHSVTRHPTQVNSPRLTPAMQAGTRFTYPGGMED